MEASAATTCSLLARRVLAVRLRTLPYGTASFHQLRLKLFSILGAIQERFCPRGQMRAPNSRVEYHSRRVGVRGRRGPVVPFHALVAACKVASVFVMQ